MYCREWKDRQFGKIGFLSQKRNNATRKVFAQFLCTKCVPFLPAESSKLGPAITIIVVILLTFNLMRKGIHRIAPNTFTLFRNSFLANYCSTHSFIVTLNVLFIDSELFSSVNDQNLVRSLTQEHFKNVTLYPMTQNLWWENLLSQR